MHHVFGPVPSRRLGRSIGINNIPPKVCSYACVYCQVGQTTRRERVRQNFFSPQKLVAETEQKLADLVDARHHVDYLTLVSDGEPTLDANLGILIQQLKRFGFPVAVLTNASLLHEHDVRKELATADWVSVKIDAASKKVWKNINRPVPDLSLEKIQDGIRRFAQEFHGHLVTETMLLKNFNDFDKEIVGIAHFLSEIQPHTAYISIPTRPPAVPTVDAADTQSVAQAFDIFTAAHLHAELLIGYEGNAFAATGSAKDDLLSITAVHPMRQDAVEELVRRNRSTWHLIDELIAEHQLLKIRYNDKIYYTRPPQVEQDFS